MKNKVPLNLLPEVLAQIVDFAWDDYGPTNGLPEEVAWCIAHVCACFVAQNTRYGGEEGVEDDSVFSGLEIDEHLPYAKRLEMARVLVDAWEKES